MEKEHILAYPFSDLEEYFESIGWKAYQARQLYDWLYRKRVSSFAEMSDLSLKKREYLEEHFEINTISLVTRQVSRDGTRKYLFKMKDGALVESVLMYYDYGRSVCVSSQVGCNMGCTFCASGLLKKQRNLTAGEMTEEVLYIQRELDEENDRVSHVVVMGTGEPFDNYDNVMAFLAAINDDRGLAIGARHITISTCGLADQIRRFADEHRQYNLAISLHAPNDALRDTLMPVNKAYPIPKLMEAIDYYCQENNRRLTFEYILLKDVNDSEKNARELADLIRGYNAYVNLIPYNKVDEKGFVQTDYLGAMRFYDRLMNLGVKATLRQEHGADIDAACGQLRAKNEKKDAVQQ